VELTYYEDYTDITNIVTIYKRELFHTSLMNRSELVIS